MWQRRLSQKLGAKLVPLGAGLLAVTLEHGQATLRSMHVRDGAEDWSISFDSSDCLSLLRTGQQILSIASDRLTFIDAARKRVVLEVAAKEGQRYTGAALSKKGRFYLLSESTGTLYLSAIDARSGTTIWQTKTSQGTASTTVLADAGGLLMAIRNSHERLNIRAYAAATGDLAWERDDIEGSPVTHWAAFNLFDLAVKEKGVWGLNSSDGSDRSLRFFGMKYVEAHLMGQSFLVVTENDGLRELLSFDTVSSELKGKIPTDIQRIIGAHSAEVLTEHPDGYPEIFSLPKLNPIQLPHAKEIGQICEIAWARDVAYLVAKDQRTITAIDLRYA